MEVKTYNVFGFIVKEYYPYNIYVIDKFISDEDCKMYIDLIEKVQPMSIKTTLSETNNIECYTKQFDELSDFYKKDKDIEDKINNMARNCFFIFNYFNTNFKNNFNTDFTFDQRCNIELRKIYGRTKKHYGPIHSKNLFFKNYSRCLTIIINFNDNYDGGIYHFIKQNIKIKLSAASVILFPPYWTHTYEVTSVGEGQFSYTISTGLIEKNRTQFTTTLNLLI
jgi:hypothetical protein